MQWLNIITFFETGNLGVEVNGIPQQYQHHLVKVPYNAKVTLNCKLISQSLLTFINTTLDLDHNFLNGVSPHLFISANVTIDLFVAKNRGFYSCVTNTNTKSSLRTLVTSSESYYYHWVHNNALKL